MKQKLIFTLFGMLVFIMFTIAGIQEMYKERGIEIVDCFDRYGNKIIGERCIDEPSDWDEYKGIFLIGLGVVSAVILSFFGQAFDDLDKMSKPWENY